MALCQLNPSVFSSARSYDGKLYTRWAAGNKPVPLSSTYFDSLYSPSWTPNSGTNALTSPTQAKPAKSPSILTGGYVDQRFGTYIRRTTDVTDSTGAAGNGVQRHEYSRRQAWNADSTRFFAQNGSGWWFLYDANTLQVIPQGITTGNGTGGIQGMGGDCEPIWHPTDPNKWWHTSQNGGLVWWERTFVASGTAPTQTVLIDFGPKLAALGAPWNTGNMAWWMGEGRPSTDGRWWAMAIEVNPSSPTNVGFIMYDRQTDTITGTVLSGGNRPNWVSTSPLGNYIIASWYGAAKASLAAELAGGVSTAAGVWAFNRDGTTARVLSVLGEHSDMAIDKTGAEVYCAISFHGAGDGTPGNADGVFARRINDGTTWIYSMPPYDAGAGFHISGCATARPGWIVVGMYGALDGGPYGGTVSVVELTPTSPRIYRLAHTHRVFNDYFSEPHATPNRDLTRIVFTSDFEANANPCEDYQIVLPSWAIPEN